MVDGMVAIDDLLFYHVRLHRYFAIELKAGDFQPEYAGKLSFYISAIDGTMRTSGDGPTIGLLLCESRSGPIVEYALQNLIQPIGVSTYRVTREAARARSRRAAERGGSPGSCQEATFGDRDLAQGAGR
jgi:hypothetical protein